jgi:hypothetical protein
MTKLLNARGKHSKKNKMHTDAPRGTERHQKSQDVLLIFHGRSSGETGDTWSAERDESNNLGIEWQLARLEFYLPFEIFACS